METVTIITITDDGVLEMTRDGETGLIGLLDIDTGETRAADISDLAWLLVAASAAGDENVLVVAEA